MSSPGTYLAAFLCGGGLCLIGQLLTKMNVEPARFIQACETEIARIPKVTGSGREPDKVYITPELDAALTEAEQTAARMKDDYVSVEHIFLALMDRANAGAKRVFEACGIRKNEFLNEMQAVRGNTRVTSDQPEETYDVLNKYGQELVELARKQKLDPVIGRDSEIRNVIRILLRATSTTRSSPSSSTAATSPTSAASGSSARRRAATGRRVRRRSRTASASPRAGASASWRCRSAGSSTRRRRRTSRCSPSTTRKRIRSSSDTGTARERCSS